MPDGVREHLTRDQRQFVHPESLQIFRFTASSLQFTHSSSTGFRSEITWHEIRDHSFIQNHSRSSDSQLLLFSSLTHLLQGSDQRTPDTRSETILHPESLQIFRFTASLQFTHSSSTGFRSENTWHEIRDHPSSRITPDLQIHSFFSSVHLTHLLQGSDQRTPDTRSETIPSSRITPDLQIHSFFSSVHLTHLLQGSDQRTPDTRSETILHPESLQIFRFTASSLQFTSLIFYRVQIRGLEWPAEAWFCAQWPILVLFSRFVFWLLYGCKIQTWPIIRFLTESVTYLFFICWYLIVRRHFSATLKKKNYLRLRY